MKYQLKGHRVLIEIEVDQSRKHLECFYYLHSLGCHLLAFHLLVIPTFILGERKVLLPSSNVIEKNAIRNISTTFWSLNSKNLKNKFMRLTHNLSLFIKIQDPKM